MTMLPEPPGFDLESPGTFRFDGARSTRGLALNRFALSLKKPLNRERFLANEVDYMSKFDLSPECSELIRRRDWTALLAQGGHLQALLKLAATVGQSLYDIGAHNCGVDVDTLRDACPRHVAGLENLEAKGDPDPD